MGTISKRGIESCVDESSGSRNSDEYSLILLGLWFVLDVSGRLVMNVVC